MKAKLLSILLVFSVTASAQSLRYHQTEISLDTSQTTFKELSIKMSELGDAELAKDFKKIHRRRENLEPGWLSTGITVYTIGLWETIQNGKIDMLSASYAAIGIGIALYDDFRQAKTEKLIIEAIDKYNSRFANHELRDVSHQY